MDDLITWLRGLLDEDERVARAAAECGSWRLEDEWAYGLGVGVARTTAPGFILPEQWDHIRRHDPASVLADITAKRAILDEIVPALEGYEWDAVAERSTTERLVRLLASAYADRPGYQEAWRP